MVFGKFKEQSDVIITDMYINLFNKVTSNFIVCTLKNLSCKQQSHKNVAKKTMNGVGNGNLLFFTNKAIISSPTYFLKKSEGNHLTHIQ